MASHAAHQSHDHGHGHGHGEPHPLVGHLVPYSTLFATGAALLVLTVITVAARYVDLGEANIYLAIGIAVVKATLVSLFFMHLRWDRPFNLMVLVGSMLFVVLMMVFCMMDVGQYMGTENKGNPKAVQNYLDGNAPFAPITSKK
jgi:cytochrome c oxidase subunit 4